MTELHLVVWGEGVPVILVHGSMSTGLETFAEQKPLSDSYRLILLDRRGYGGSPFTRCSDFEVDAHDIVDLLEHPTHLVGHSYGAVACLVAAAMQPANDPLPDGDRTACVRPAFAVRSLSSWPLSI